MSAQVTSTGRSNQIAITNENGCLSQTETEHVVQEAEKYHGEDEENKTKIGAQQERQPHRSQQQHTSSSKQPSPTTRVVQEREVQEEERKEFGKEVKKKREEEARKRKTKRLTRSRWMHQEATEGILDLRQGGRNEDSHDGGVARRQSPQRGGEDPERRDWK